MNRSEAAKLRAAKALSKDPEYFAKLAARGKGIAQPNRARVIDKDMAAAGGRNRGKSLTNQQRKQRSKELAQALKDELEKEARRRKATAAKIAATKAKRAEQRHTNHIERQWDEEETTNLDSW